MIKKIKLIFILLLAVNTGFAINFTVEAPSVVSIGEGFRIGFKVDAKPDSFTPPSLSDFRVIAGPTTSSSIDLINGTQQHTYVYYVEALKEGVSIIPPAEIIVDGKSLKTKEFPIEVIKEKSAQQPSGQTGQPQTTSGVNADDFFIRLEFNKTNLYRGESLVASLKVYTRVGILDVYNLKVPTFTGLYTQELDVSANENSFKRENINNKVYNVAVMKKWLFFPQRGGQIKIDPVELTIAIQVPKARQGGSIFDDFFGSQPEVSHKVLKTSSVNLNIKDLPSNAPASFAGAVGDFKMDAVFDRTEIMANQALAYTVTISGTGNLKLVEVPKINFPTDFEAYDPKVSEKINSTNAGTVGSKKYEYTLIPRSPGNFNIPALNFSYFNPSTGKYVELSSSDVTINVEKDPNAIAGASPTSPITQSTLQRDIHYLGTDILFIKTSPLSLQPVGYMFFGSKLFWLTLLILIVAFIILFFIMRNIEKTRGDVALMRNKRANKVARKRLKLSEKLMKEGNKHVFYEELSKAMWGYVSDKLNIPAASLSKNNVQEKLQEREVNQELISTLIAVIDECEYARYAPDKEGVLESLYTKAIDVISKLER